MSDCGLRLILTTLCLGWIWGDGEPVGAHEPWRPIFPEQRRIDIRHPSELAQVRLPDVPAPPTVAVPPDGEPTQYLSLDQAIRTALANSEVVRVLAGVGAVSSGSTIYDPAITNTQIDEARGPFDPSLRVDSNTFRRHLPQAGFVDPADPFGGVVIGGDPTYENRTTLDLSKRTTLGGVANLRFDANPSRTSSLGLPLNPQSRRDLELSYTQPLWQGSGYRANTAPIVIARIETERSFFQFKGSMQRSVLGVVEAYWAVVFARTDVWVREQQVKQGEEAFKLADARLRVGGRTDTGERVFAARAQAQSALANFRASLVSSRAILLQREAALRDMLGLPPSGGPRFVPDTPPSTEKLETEWESLVALAERYRPDIIELKLVLEADEQSLLLARNQALPRVDAVALYRWNGLAGRTPDRRIVVSDAGEFPEWQLGVNFSVPLGLRQDRAALRRQELLIFRDRANLDQGLLTAIHQLASSYRSLAQYYEEYLAFKEARIAARVNLNFQAADYAAGRAIYLNVLQAITNWGNAVSAESQALAQYNVELARLELETGTILETHGVRFVEERYGSVGPLGPGFRCYPRDLRPRTNVDRYESSSEPAENLFNLEDPLATRRERRDRKNMVIPEPLPTPEPEPEP